MTRLECLSRAAQADELAAVLSLIDEKVRFRNEAEYWRQRAELVDTPPPAPTVAVRHAWWRPFVSLHLGRPPTAH